MKKLKLSLQGLEGAEVLTREQLKRVMGGDEGSGGDGKCCICFGDEPHQVSCWYTTGTCQDVCSRVYPGNPNSNGGTCECIGCTMN